MEKLERARLCAKLAKFAYIAGNPEKRGLVDQLRQATPTTSVQLPESLSDFDGHQVIKFEEYHTRSWIHSYEHQHRFFRSYAYLLHFRKQNDVDTIIVGFRGTFNYTTHTGENVIENGVTAGRPSCLSRFINWVLDCFAPSNYGLSDFYYDATIIRVPYREGAVWKWYAYWGTLILEWTRRARGWFSGPRRVAADWISRPYCQPQPQGQDRQVHLGFWSLWASQEGFSGYDGQGDLPGDRRGVIQHLRRALQEAQNKNERTEVIVVGHSLGGAVSCFAALAVAKELERIPGPARPALFHATFGAPPVGTTTFKTYFDEKMSPHRSWAIYHCRDVIPQCFAFCASTWRLGWLGPLGWWSGWSRVGEQTPINLESNTQNQADGRKKMRCKDRLKWCGIVLASLGFLIFSNSICVIVGLVWYLRHRRYFKDKENPRTISNHTRGNADRLDSEEVGLAYHSLQLYISLLDRPDVFTLGPPPAHQPQKKWWKFWA
ncbi:hypothetical protein PG989_001060 [Apiospora arundinis]